MIIEMCFVKNMAKSSVIAETVELATKHTEVLFEYREEAHLDGKIPIAPVGIRFADLAPHWRKVDLFSSLWMAGNLSEEDITQWCSEFERLRGLINRPLSEEVLEDTHPMTGGYIYVIDGKPRMCEWMASGFSERRMTVGEYKRREGVSEVRRCDMYGRQDRLPPHERKKFEKSFRTQVGDDPSLQPHRWNKAGTRINQARRRPRSSNKIKKVG